MGLPPGDDIFDAPPTIVGELCDIYTGEYGSTPAIFKVARDDSEQHVMDESVTLATLRQNPDPKFEPYLPVLRNSISHGGRLVNIFEPLDGFFTLEQVRDRYPDGLEPRDMAWMLRRLLVVIGFTHRAGFVHGAVVPSNVMIHPEQHGLVLIDWCYAVPDNEALDKVSEKYVRWYPPEVVGDVVSPATDIYMAAKTGMWLIGGDPWADTLPDTVASEYRAFFAGCTRLARAERPLDAWMVLKMFDELLERMYGPRKFRPFTMAS